MIISAVAVDESWARVRVEATVGRRPKKRRKDPK